MANPKGAGRKPKEISKVDFEKLCALQCTQKEICAFFEVDHKTLQKWTRNTYGLKYSLAYEEKRSVGMISLRRAQWRMAEKSAAMAIFLGKNYLGQTDGVEQKLEVSTDSQNQLVLALRSNASMIDEEDADEPEGVGEESETDDWKDASESDDE